MSNQLIDWSSPQGIQLRNGLIQMALNHIGPVYDPDRNGPDHMQRLRDEFQPMPRTCISCGSKTQPCCGH